MPASDKQVERYPVPAADIGQPFSTRLEIRRSVFLAQTAQCASASEARDFVCEIRRQNPDATHHCWAFVAGAPASTANIGFSDDGEPHGTAGRPILNVLLHSGAGRIATVVSRWFGGIKLGTGGLARAYQTAAQENVEKMPRAILMPRVRFRASCEYPLLDNFRRLILDMEGEIEAEEYGGSVNFLFNLPTDRVDAGIRGILDASSGRIRPERLPEVPACGY